MPRLPKESQRNHRDLFVYENSSQAPFDVFLERSNEKQKVGRYLYEQMLRMVLDNSRPATNILDIGSGDSSLVFYALQNLSKAKIKYTAIEPVVKSVYRAKQTLSKLGIDWEVENAVFDDFTTDTRYDMIIASNLYHLDEHEIPDFIKKVKNMLSDNGKFYFIYRSSRHDDILELRKQYEGQMYDEFKQPRTMEIIKRIVNQSTIPYRSVDEINSEVDFGKDSRTRSKLIEFIFNRSFDSIDTKIMDSVQKFIADRQDILKSCQAVMIFDKQ